MKLRSFQALLFVCLSILLGSRVASAQQVQPLEPEWLQRMYSEGWQKVQEGVLQRNQGQGQIETFSYGAEGLQWVLEHSEAQLARFEEKYGESPNEDLAALIEQLKGRIGSLRTNLVTASSAETFDGEELNACSYSYDATATVGPKRSTRGVVAKATASFDSTDCGHEGNIFATAYAHAIQGTLETTKTQSDPKSSTDANGFAGITSLAEAEADGSTDCDSYAAASVNVPGLNIDHIVEPDRSTSCPPDVATSITGPTLITTDFYTSSCADVTWSANTTGGTPGYTYQWYVDSDAAGTGSTLTKQYCSVDKVVNVRVVATDQNQWSTEATYSTEIQHVPAVSVSANGLDQVNLSSTTPCMDVTWSANASGGHPGYTYTWYTGTGTTAEGTGSTFVKRYCNSSQTVTARVVASDADGHTAEATKTTNVVYPLSVTAGGPSTVVTDSYTSTCADVTWTTSVLGGAPGYTYQWFLGTGTTVLGTSATFTQNYCSTNGTATAKVVVTDSQGSTASATFTTSLVYRAPITVSISGPASVATNGTTPCANVTWTASASSTGGNHGGFTYTWYIGTGTTVQSTSNTLTKQYCNTSTSVTVKAVATASDGHSSQATKTTSVVYTPPPAVAVSGPSTVTTDSYTTTCADVTWTSSVSGGAPGYTYKWYLGTSTTIVGTSATYTKNYCSTNGSVTAKVVVTDSQGTTASATFTTSLVYRAPITVSISGPASVVTNGTTPCANVTWTASASSTGGNHSGFTYTWYIGTGTVAQSTSNTLTKQYCSTSTSVTVKAVAKASDGHSAESTMTTAITYSNPLATTISGPTDVYLDGSYQCETVTWSASSTGGTSGYTYTWYIGTTQVGTGTSYSKSYCRTNQTVNVKVIAKDSANTTAQDTHTTNIYYDSLGSCLAPAGPGDPNIPVDPSC